MSEKLVEQLRNTHPSFTKDKALAAHKKGQGKEGEKKQAGQPEAAV